MEMRNSENKEVKLNDSLSSLNDDTGYSTPIFGTETSGVAMPKDKINDEPVAPGVAAEMIRQYLSIEGNATQNLATFCQTYMEPEAKKTDG